MATSDTPQNAVILPALPQTLLLGLDTLALTPSPRFLGLKDLPQGWHFLYAGADSALATRTGYWLYTPNSSAKSSPWLRIYKWNGSNEVLEASEDANEIAYWQRRLIDRNDRELGVSLVPFHVDASDASQTVNANAQTPFPERADMKPLTNFITPALLAHITGATSSTWDDEYPFSTAASSPEDRDDIPGLSRAERNFSTGPVGAILGEERELSFVGIDLKRTWREGAVGRERTIDAQDRSAALERIIEGAQEWASHPDPGTIPQDAEWGCVILGEMQVTFLMVLLLANWSCLEEWKRIMALCLTCERLVPERPAFFAHLIQILRLQLQRCDDIEGGLFDVSGDDDDFLKQLLRRFRNTLRDLENQSKKDASDGLDLLNSEWKELEEWTEQEWGWILDGQSILKSGKVQLEDGETVDVQLEGFEAEDETGEYAPVVVDLG